MKIMIKLTEFGLEICLKVLFHSDFVVRNHEILPEVDGTRNGSTNVLSKGNNRITKYNNETTISLEK